MLGRGRARNIQSQFIVIGLMGEEQFYKEMIISEQRLAKILKYLILTSKNNSVNKAGLEYLNKFVEQTDRRHIYQEKIGFKNENYLKKIKFSLQILINNGPNEISDFFAKLKLSKGYKQADLVKDSMLADESFYADDKAIYNLLFEIRNSYNSENEFDLKLQTIGFLLKDNFNSAISLFQSKSKLTQSILQLMCQQLDFGNLITPFEFVSENFSLNENIKLIIEFNEQLIQILFFHNKILYKIEVTFDSIDKICCLDNRENDFALYLPLKHVPFVYCLSTTESQSIVNLSQIEEKFLEWQRACNINSAKIFSIKLQLDKKELEHVVNSFHAINSSKIIFSSIKVKEISFKIENLKTMIKSNDFNLIYAIECFISLNENIIKGKIDNQFANKLVNLKPNQFLQVIEQLILCLPNSRFIDINKLLDKLITNDLSIEIPLNSQILMIKRLTVTPSRIIFHLPEPCFGNRVVRQFKSDHFIR